MSALAQLATGAARRLAPWPLGSRNTIALAIGLRLLLSPLQHTWDSQTWWNVAAELGQEPNPIVAVQAPFERMRELGLLARGSDQAQYYEYWAYPPGMLWVWWPIVRIWTLATGPLPEQFAAVGTFTARPLPLVLSLAMKVPIIVADLVCSLLLVRLAGPRLGRWFLLNPYVLLVGLWTFDSAMVACLLGALFAAERQRWGLAGALLGLGAAIKFTPIVVLPAVLLWALRSDRSPARAAVRSVLGFGGMFLLVSLPALDGLLYVLDFHASRRGVGMTWQSIWDAVASANPFADLGPTLLYVSPQIGTLTLVGALLVALWLAWARQLGVIEMSLVLLLAFLAGSKLVNEVYPLPAMALASVYASRAPSRAAHVLLAILWVTPLAFALVNVPAWGFLLAPAEALGLVTLDQARLFFSGYALSYQQLAPVLAIVGTGFQVACLWGIGAICISAPNGWLLPRVQARATA